ncbi:unnamed protein product [Rhizophagus irregularis]|nr:unnamed protein product [Rhizophagus irregularis]CAB4418861.1 unnamed protein product [Rhizophagus irregularis]
MALNTFSYPELDDYGKGVGSIPEFIMTNYQLITTKSFVQGVRKTFSNKVIAYKWKFQRKESSDFGDGFYTTPSIIYAPKHIRIIRNSTLLIFNWKDLGGNNITTGYINKDEWISTVKGYICINNITKPELPNYS